MCHTSNRRRDQFTAIYPLSSLSPPLIPPHPPPTPFSLKDKHIHTQTSQQKQIKISISRWKRKKSRSFQTIRQQSSPPSSTTSSIRLLTIPSARSTASRSVDCSRRQRAGKGVGVGEVEGEGEGGRRENSTERGGHTCAAVVRAVVVMRAVKI